MSSGPVVVLQLKRLDAIHHMKQLCGPTDPRKARLKTPISLRAIFGTDQLRNAVHCSASPGDEKRESDLCFNAFLGKNEMTFAWIKPDAIMRGHTEAIKDRIKAEGFTIESEKEFTLSSKQASTFYQNHRSHRSFTRLVAFMSSGRAVAMILRKDNAVRDFKELCGPPDSNKARETHPRSIRALYGLDIIRNAIHCSSSAETAFAEADTVFTGFCVGVQSLMFMIKPDAVSRGHADAIIGRIKAEGYIIEQKYERTLSREHGKELIQCNQDIEESPAEVFKTIEHITSGPTICMVTLIAICPHTLHTFVCSKSQKVRCSHGLSNRNYLTLCNRR